MGEIKLVGLGPFELPVAQSAKATAVGNTVEVSFEVLSDPNQPLQQVEAVRIQIRRDQATELAAQILESVKKADVSHRANNPLRCSKPSCATIS